MQGTKWPYKHKGWKHIESLYLGQTFMARPESKFSFGTAQWWVEMAALSL